MASTVPAKSQPLHNFDLPHLKWNKDGNSSGHHQRRRSIKSPSRRPNTSSPSPIRQSPLRDSVSATPPRHQSPLPDSSALSSRESPVHGDYLMKQSPIRGESSKPSPIRECVKQSLTGGDSERQPLLNRDAVRQFIRRDVVLNTEYLKNSKGSLIEYRRNHSKGSAAFDSIRNEVFSSNSEQAKDKLDKKSKGKEVDEAGSKRSKILIKIPCKNNKLEEENPQEEPPNIDNNDAQDDTDENVAGVAEKGSVSATPEKHKAHSSLINANKPGEKEGNCSGGSEKKEKRKLSISIALSKDEIEEDIFILTGSKPARRPKKRAKNIQKQLDFVFPGLWLVSITPESYKVSENSLKDAGCDLVDGIPIHSWNTACYIVQIFNVGSAGCDQLTAHLSGSSVGPACAYYWLKALFLYLFIFLLNYAESGVYIGPIWTWKRNKDEECVMPAEGKRKLAYGQRSESDVRKLQATGSGMPAGLKHN
ncbi:hypothetical protein Sango_0194200 [Sesamum angolense]|uniref:Uncharacterized protein n=1 Tax=Sesamum angolense TaxID=2727404 RepID=A0AAE2C6T2_9LAMI|nr:hypothetical protein Sango_0194200 [Sesamum angolense]